MYALELYVVRLTARCSPGTGFVLLNIIALRFIHDNVYSASSIQQIILGAITVSRTLILGAGEQNRQNPCSMVVESLWVKGGKKQDKYRICSPS